MKNITIKILIALAIFLGFAGPVSATTLTVYPEDGFVDPVDGHIRRNGVNQSLTDIRAGAGTTADSDSFNAGVYLESDVSNSANNFYALYRGMFLFNTSSIPDTGATISSAVMSVKGSKWTSGDEFAGTKPDLCIGQGATAANDTLANGDYAQSSHGTTAFSTCITDASWTNGDGNYHDFTFNATGIAAISLTSRTKISMQTSWDMNNSFTGTWATGKRGGWQITADASGTTSDPKLVVTYSTGRIMFTTK